MSGSVIVLEPLPGVGLKTSEPNLMPFHVSYTGPALISTFMEVKPAKEETGAPAQQEAMIEATEGSSTETKGDAVEKPAEAKEAAETDAAVSMAVDATPTINKPEDLQSAPSSTRTVSTFRGRIIQGLKVDLPEGYRGLVLQAPPPHTTTSTPSSSKSSGPSTTASSSKTKSKTTQDDAADDEEYPTARSTRRRGRLARSAVFTKVVDLDKEEEKARESERIDVDEEVTAAMDVDATGLDDGSPQRRLKPVGQFSSFTIWHPDNPVVELQDEYYRSVHEWTALAEVLHQGDDEE